VSQRLLIWRLARISVALFLLLTLSSGRYVPVVFVLSAYLLSWVLSAYLVAATRKCPTPLGLPWLPLYGVVEVLKTFGRMYILAWKNRKSISLIDMLSQYESKVLAGAIAVSVPLVLLSNWVERNHPALFLPLIVVITTISLFILWVMVYAVVCAGIAVVADYFKWRSINWHKQKLTVWQFLAEMSKIRTRMFTIRLLTTVRQNNLLLSNSETQEVLREFASAIEYDSSSPYGTDLIYQGARPKVSGREKPVLSPEFFNWYCEYFARKEKSLPGRWFEQIRLLNLQSRIKAGLRTDGLWQQRWDGQDSRFLDELTKLRDHVSEV
jgi:hypothetical protein